ncbi:MAG TPA: DUF308 domain-containing protein [Candidatus Dormibacteraeota bacterium]
MDATLGVEMRAMLARLGGAWGWIVAYGVASVLAGVIAILWPGSTLVVIGIIFALQLLVAAIYQFVFAFAIPDEIGWLRALMALLAILSFIVAVYLFGHVLLTLLILATLLGIYWVAQGIIELFVAIGHPELRGRAWMLLSGILSIAAGGVVIVFPATSLVFLTLVLGIWLVIFGVILITRGWMLRSLVSKTIGAAKPAM